MRIRRRLPLVFTVLAIAGAVALAVTVRKHAPPEPARLLPTADGFFYVNLKWLRRVNVSELPPVPHDPLEPPPATFESNTLSTIFAAPETWAIAPPTPKLSGDLPPATFAVKVHDVTVSLPLS